MHIFTGFKINEIVYMVFFCKTINKIIFVFVYSP